MVFLFSSCLIELVSLDLRRWWLTFSSKKYFLIFFNLVKIGSHLAEVRLLKQHLEITKYLSSLRPHNEWWIGATDASPIAPKEGEFVWLTDNAYVDHIGNHLVVKPPFDYSNESHDRHVTFWGPGQPDNWPNQVNMCTFITNISCCMYYFNIQIW